MLPAPTLPVLTLPVLTLRNAVLFPYVVEVISVDRPRSLAAVEAALATQDKLLAVFAQHDAAVEEPGRQHLYPIGTQAVVKQTRRTDRGLQVTILGLERLSLESLEPADDHDPATVKPLPTTATVKPLPTTADVGGAEDAEIDALQRQVLDLARRLQETVDVDTDADIHDILSHLEGPMHLVYLLGSMVNLTLEKAQILLQLDSPATALKMLDRYLAHELQVLDLQQKISAQTRTEIDREQREYYLRRQLQAIQEELGEASTEETEMADATRRLEALELPEAVRQESERELRRLSALPAASPEFQVVRSHLELVLELPWSRRTDDRLDPAHARGVLDEAHYGLREIKERILEHLAVLSLNPDAKAPILCLVGPPGVGKTSLGESIAHALGRRFERLSLGGLRDEAELRGHRRTYLGALPGRILQAIRRAGVSNPLLLLDEIDKVGRDYRGDPTSVLLEILDPAQNHTFRDNYLGLPFDLSKIFFITTANSLDGLPRPLLDRMEVLRLPGYSEEEKLEIVRRYLLPRERQEAGLEEDQFRMDDEAVFQVIQRYTREAGVRELRRMLGRLARKAALRCAEKRYAEGHGYTKNHGEECCEDLLITAPDLAALLGPERFLPGELRRDLPPGVVAGLAWTETGGEVLYVEAIVSRRGDELILTGQLGDVMKESARAAQSYILSLGEDASEGEPGVHIHVPSGAIRKDGPSAGVTMATALASLYSALPVRADTAMTGEITLSGLVLPVGGVREKVLAARRAGLKRVILPAANEKDLRELPENVRQEMEIVFARTLGDVLAAAVPGAMERLTS